MERKVYSIATLFRGRRVNARLYFADGIDGKASAHRVLANELGARREVKAVELVVGDIAVHPLNLRAEVMQNAARLGGDVMRLAGAPLCRVGNRSFDEVLGHSFLSSMFVVVVTLVFVPAADTAHGGCPLCNERATGWTRNGNPVFTGLSCA